jgi:hypothetical protein
MLEEAGLEVAWSERRARPTLLEEPATDWKKGKGMAAGAKCHNGEAL